MNLRGSMKLRAKLLLSPALSAVLVALCLGISIWLMVCLQSDSRNSYQRAEAADFALYDVQTQLGDVHASLYRTVATAEAADGKAIEQAQDKQAARLAELAAHLAKLTGDESGKDMQVLVAALREQIASYRVAANLAIDRWTLNADTRTAALRTADQQFKSITKTMSELATVLQAHAEAEIVVLDRQARRNVALLAGFGVLGCLLALGFGWITQRRIVNEIRAGAEAASQVAQGRLDVKLEGRSADEVGDLMRSLDTMVRRLSESLHTVRVATDSIGTASTEIAIGNTDLSARTEQAASNLQQTASSMEQLTVTVRQSADAARTANQLASSAAAVAAKGGQVVSQVVSTMNEINVSSRKISDIIGVIDGIAFQTNILALNAAVEAARAGEQGRGFAVVAGEVRSLAQRSAEAAKEIKLLIGTSVDKVASGSKLVRDAGSTMNEIVASVQRVTDIIGEITAAAAEQSDGIEQVNSSVTQLDRMTQQNAALVQESAAAAESLKGQAVSLAQVVGTFRLEPHASASQVSEAR